MERRGTIPGLVRCPSARCVVGLVEGTFLEKGAQDRFSDKSATDLESGLATGALFWINMDSNYCSTQLTASLVMEAMNKIGLGHVGDIPHLIKNFFGFLR